MLEFWLWVCSSKMYSDSESREWVYSTSSRWSSPVVVRERKDESGMENRDKLNRSGPSEGLLGKEEKSG